MVPAVVFSGINLCSPVEHHQYKYSKWTSQTCIAIDQYICHLKSHAEPAQRKLYGSIELPETSFHHIESRYREKHLEMLTIATLCNFAANSSRCHGMFPSLGHHQVMEAARGALVTMVLKWCEFILTTHRSRPLSLIPEGFQAVEEMSWRSCC